MLRFLGPLARRRPLPSLLSAHSSAWKTIPLCGGALRHVKQYYNPKGTIPKAAGDRVVYDYQGHKPLVTVVYAAWSLGFTAALFSAYTAFNLPEDYLYHEYGPFTIACVPVAFCVLFFPIMRATSRRFINRIVLRRDNTVDVLTYDYMGWARSVGNFRVPEIRKFANPAASAYYPLLLGSLNGNFLASKKGDIPDVNIFESITGCTVDSKP
jgi:hypothetical protein